MHKIKLLDEYTIQKIAAGEIIERPASVIKELVENSLDAKATNIVVEITNGGKDYIRVTDDGEGILDSDLDLAFKRHSTSKIETVEDLFKIVSFGFRGEALSSISAVAKVEVLTKTSDSLTGTQAFVENGEIISKKPVGCPKGTTMIVRDLFYNIPVRRGFLKSESNESSYIDDTLYRFALGNTDVSFKYIKDNKVIFNTSKNNSLISNIYSLLGKDFSNNLIKVDYKSKNAHIYGYISNNTLYRGNRKHQYLYVNKRHVRNKIITNLIEDKYKSLIPINKFPVFILFIDVDPSFVDVNIHPTKQEIKFLNQDEINNSLENMIFNALNNNIYIQKLTFEREKKEPDYEELPLLFEKNLIDINVVDNNNESYNYIYKDNEKNKDIKEFNIDVINQAPKENVQIEEDLEPKSLKEPINFLNSFRIIGVVFNTYILLEDIENEKLLIMDQHAAHERVMYERYKREFESEKIAIQNLLTPEILELSTWEVDIVNKNSKLLKDLGFIVEEFGQNSIILRGVPLLFGIPQAKNFFIEILDGLTKDLKSGYDIKLDKIMKIACSKAIKGGDRITDVEIEKLIEQLKNADNPYTCPHGRPTIIEITKKDIEKEFKRIM
ncbi:MAG TPA: DNA mismatch repair endonuclease MutL [Tissierellia bacterium]|nr:DNA mismatch repair endonuclease MutL [Tissierellia bacterium]